MFRHDCQPGRVPAEVTRRWLVLLCLIGLAGSGVPAFLPCAVAQFSIERPDPVTVVFQLEKASGQRAVEACRQAWISKGSELSEALWPWPAPADTVTCLVMGTETFRRGLAVGVPDWGVGLAIPGGRLIALDFERLPAVGRSAREVFLHEMTHALLFQAARGTWLPTWFHEGVAMQLSGDWRFIDTISVVLDGHLPELARLSGPFPRGTTGADRAYRTSLLAVEFLQREYGDHVVLELVAAAAQKGDFTAAFRDVTGEDVELFASRFAGSMKLKYGWMLMIFRWPTLFVVMALVFAWGAIRRIANKRRQLAELDDSDEMPGP